MVPQPFLSNFRNKEVKAQLHRGHEETNKNMVLFNRFGQLIMQLQIVIQ